MPITARTIGGPGAGKTHRALDIVGMCLEKVIRDPLKIGFVSFTRTARQEAAARAADKFNMKASSLEKEGWFRTLHCSPPDEPILTLHHGYVPIASLDSSLHELVGYYPITNNILRGPRGRNPDNNHGYPFTMGVRHHDGDLLTIETPTSRTRITPDHRVRARLNINTTFGFLVYLMKKGNWFRIGVTRTLRIPYRSGGIGGRLTQEKAEAAWILGAYKTRHAAILAESYFQARYGIPSATFEACTSRLKITTNNLHELHESLVPFVLPRVAQLISDTGINLDWPLFVRQKGSHCVRWAASSFELVASNLIPGLMEVPVFPADLQGKKPEWRQFSVTREQYSGPVYSLDVPPHEHYISGGLIVHNSCCYKCLGVGEGELLTGTAEDTQWLRNALDDENARLGTRASDDDYFVAPSSYGTSEKSLAMWDAARNRQVPLAKVYWAVERSDPRCPSLSEVEEVVSRFEAAKKRDGLLDFCDLLMKFAGRRFTGSHRAPFEEVHPDGDFPILPVWLHDEAQDMSLLTSLVFKRLSRHSQFVYLMGDFWQAIYDWCGSDGRIFSEWQVVKEEVLPLSYRCRSNILAKGDRLMLAGGYKPRDFRSKEEGGKIVRCYVEEALASARPGEDTLVLARTNEIARLAAKFFDDELIPWRPSKGDAKVKVAPAREAGVAAIITLRKGGSINAEAIWRMLQLVPARASGEALFERGTKKWYDTEENRRASLQVNLADLHAIAGATPFCCNLIASGGIFALLDEKAAKMVAMADRHGLEAVGSPTIRVGTLHSAKGQQAEHVVLINELPYPTLLSIESPDGMDEERRVWYTGITRAKGRLTIGESTKEGFPI